MVGLSVSSSALGLLALFSTMVDARACKDCRNESCYKVLAQDLDVAERFCGRLLRSTEVVTATPTATAFGTLFTTVTITDSTATVVELTSATVTATESSTAFSTDVSRAVSVFASTEVLPSTQTVTSTSTIDYENFNILLRRHGRKAHDLPGFDDSCSAKVDLKRACACLGGPIPTTTKTVTPMTITESSFASGSVTASRTATVTDTSVIPVTTTVTVSTTVRVATTSTTVQTSLTTVAQATQTVVCADCTPGQQAIANPSFEEEDGSSGSLMWQTYADRGITITNVAAAGAIDGDRVMKTSLVASTSNTYPNSNLAQKLLLCGEPDATYTLSFYIGVDQEALDGGAYVNSEFDVSLGGVRIFGKSPVCAGDASDCNIRRAPGSNFRKVTIGNVKPTTCNPELLIVTHFKKSRRASPSVLIDLIQMTLDGPELNLPQVV